MANRGLRIAVSLLAAAFFLFLFFRKLDLAQIARHMGEARPFWMIMAVACQGAHLLLRSTRWRLLLSPMKPGIRLYSLFSTTAIGYLLSFVFFRIGEVLRPLMLASRERISGSGALATCVLERLMDLLSVMLLFGFYLIFLFRMPAGGTGAVDMEQVRSAGLMAGVLALASFPILYLMVHYRHRLFDALDRRFAGKNALLPRLLHSFLGGFDVVKGGKVFTLAWAQSIAIWLVITLSIWCSLRAFDLGLSFGDSLMMLALLNIGIAVPTPGAVGSYEYMGQLGLENIFGVEPNRAAAAILVTHALAIGPVIIIGILLVWKEGMSLAGLTRMPQQPAAPGGAEPVP